eukprot:74911-Amphidinium_carterae.1
MHSSFKLLKIALMSFGAVSPARLDRYAEYVSQLVARFPDHWALIYSADTYICGEKKWGALGSRGASLSYQGFTYQLPSLLMSAAGVGLCTLRSGGPV